MTKIAVSLPDQLVVDARAAVRDGRAASVSAYVAAAMERFEAERALDATIEELHALHGAPTEADSAWARTTLGLA
jgi:antitoxin ParD1/3/4